MKNVDLTISACFTDKTLDVKKEINSLSGMEIYLTTFNDIINNKFNLIRESNMGIIMREEDLKNDEIFIGALCELRNIRNYIKESSGECCYRCGKELIFDEYLCESCTAALSYHDVLDKIRS